MDDAYREAFDIHGDDCECSQCGAVMDILSVEHWGDYMSPRGEVESVPICDRCYWDGRFDMEDDDDFQKEYGED